MSYLDTYSNHYYEGFEANKRRVFENNNDELSLRVQSKKARTAVFAGHARTNTYKYVHRLQDLCLRVLMDHIDNITTVGDASFDILKPMLEKCNANQLARLEKLNPHLAEDTDALWKDICSKEFRNQKPNDEDDETWRQLYFRLIKERDRKLKNITKYITDKQANSKPSHRQTQRAYINKDEKPKAPKEVRRRQEQAAMVSSSSSSSKKINETKPKVAPLMKKTLMMYKKNYRR